MNCEKQYLESGQSYNCRELYNLFIYLRIHGVLHEESMNILIELLYSLYLIDKPIELMSITYKILRPDIQYGYMGY